MAMSVVYIIVLPLYENPTALTAVSVTIVSRHFPVTESTVTEGYVVHSSISYSTNSQLLHGT